MFSFELLRVQVYNIYLFINLLCAFCIIIEGASLRYTDKIPEIGCNRTSTHLEGYPALHSASDIHSPATEGIVVKFVLDTGAEGCMSLNAARVAQSHIEKGALAF